LLPFGRFPERTFKEKLYATASQIETCAGYVGHVGMPFARSFFERRGKRARDELGRKSVLTDTAALVSKNPWYPRIFFLIKLVKILISGKLSDGIAK